MVTPKKRLTILVSNDDGIHATGIQKLAEKLSRYHDVYVVAPEQERSATGHALTLHKPLRVKEADLDFPVKGAYAVTGTPSDCVKLALHALYPRVKFDAVVSGINHGPNLGSDVLYSGTVSAALEGAMNGLPSIAISLVNGHTKLADFDPSAQFLKDFLPKALETKFPAKSILNINIPAVPIHDIVGVQVSDLGVRMYSDTYERREDPRGGVYYWLAGEIVEEAESPTSDVEAIRNNMVSVTPVHYDLTNYGALDGLRPIFDKKPTKKLSSKKAKKPLKKVAKKAAKRPKKG